MTGLVVYVTCVPHGIDYANASDKKMEAASMCTGMFSYCCNTISCTNICIKLGHVRDYMNWLLSLSLMTSYVFSWSSCFHSLNVQSIWSILARMIWTLVGIVAKSLCWPMHQLINVILPSKGSMVGMCLRSCDSTSILTLVQKTTMVSLVIYRYNFKAFSHLIYNWCVTIDAASNAFIVCIHSLRRVRHVDS